MEQYMVPQFIDVEDKIFGPITTRQFVIILVGGGSIFVAYKLLSFLLFVLATVVFLICTATLAFVRINGMPFHYFLLNIAQTFRHARLRVWDKTLTNSELRFFAAAEQEAPPLPPPTQVPLAATTLQELALIVNTGGVYRGEGAVGKQR